MSKRAKKKSQKSLAAFTAFRTWEKLAIQLLDEESLLVAMAVSYKRLNQLGERSEQIVYDTLDLAQIKKETASMLDYERIKNALTNIEKAGLIETRWKQYKVQGLTRWRKEYKMTLPANSVGQKV